MPVPSRRLPLASQVRLTADKAARHAIRNLTRPGVQVPQYSRAASGGMGAPGAVPNLRYEPALGNPDADGKALVSTTAGVRSWAAIMSDPTSATGDLIIRTAGGLGRVPIGDPGQVPTVNEAGTGLVYADAPTGTGGLPDPTGEPSGSVLRYISEEVVWDFGAFEPALGNPDVDGKALVSTAAGVRSWAAILTDPTTTQGDLIYRGASALTRLAGAAGVLVGAAGGAPSWSTSPSLAGLALTKTTADNASIPTTWTRRRGTGSVNSGDGVLYHEAKAHNGTSDVTIGAIELWAQAVSGGDIQSYFAIRGKGIGTSLSRKVMIHLGVGYVGIGNPAPDPQYMLDVRGDVRVSSTNSLRFGGTGSGDAVNNIYSNGTDLVLGAGAYLGAHKSSDGTAGATADVAVTGPGGYGTRTLHFKSGIYTGYTDS
jgi:hypothetical protein